MNISSRNINISLFIVISDLIENLKRTLQNFNQIRNKCFHVKISSTSLLFYFLCPRVLWVFFVVDYRLVKTVRILRQHSDASWRDERSCPSLNDLEGSETEYKNYIISDTPEFWVSFCSETYTTTKISLRQNILTK